jgi:hypothetical protein
MRAWVPALGGGDVAHYGDFKQVRDEHTRQSKVDIIGLTGVRRSYYEPSRSIARLSSHFTFGEAMARLSPVYAALLSFVPFAGLLALVAMLRRMRAQPASLAPAMFLALVAISQLPVVILSIAAAGRHALLASVSMNYLALYLVLFCVSLALGDPRKALARN